MATRVRNSRLKKNNFNFVRIFELTSQNAEYGGLKNRGQKVLGTKRTAETVIRTITKSATTIIKPLDKDVGSNVTETK